MSFIRPEAQAALSRYGQALAGAGIALAGLWTAAASFGVLRWIAAVAALAGLALLADGLRRARFPAGGGGPGLVELDEGQITYFGPSGGGAVALRDLDRVELLRAPGAAGLTWQLHDRGGTRLQIPAAATGAAALYDALAALPGADPGRAAGATGHTGPEPYVVWQRPRRALH